VEARLSTQASADAGTRFEFGANWTRFLADLDDTRIATAEASLRDMLGVSRLDGRNFLDIGSGSGLFSLAARRLGARVHSFDFDPQSVACTETLKRRYFPDDAAWRIQQGSVLDRSFMEKLGRFDVVYSWGVLHHTGSMWRAIDETIAKVAAEKGLLFIAIYADQGWKSDAWWYVKLFYNHLPHFLQSAYAFLVSAFVKSLVVLKYAILLRPKAIAALFRDSGARGMSAKHDRIDWIGGFPYEYAKLEALTSMLERRGFRILVAKRATSLGCHEIVAERKPSAG
jgi:2-polyprenyl-6-hydroxyphenyl methylase/3-demethylubiquinone-9 3-methyltransferase